MSSELVGDVVLVVHDDQAPGEASWQHHLDVVRNASRDTASFPFVRILVVTPGGGPTLEQRLGHKAVFSIFDGERTPIAVVTPSTRARRIVQMFTTLGFNIRAFEPSAAAASFDWLAIDAPRARRLAEALSLRRLEVNAGDVGAMVEERLRLRAAQATPESLLEAERQRIARDLHDGLGSALSGLKWRMNVVAADGRSAAIGRDLEDLDERLGGVLDELRSYVWTMRAHRFRWSEVTTYLGARMRQLDGSSRIRSIEQRGDPGLWVPRDLVAELLRTALDEVRAVLAWGKPTDVRVLLVATTDELSVELALHQGAVTRVALPLRVSA